MDISVIFTYRDIAHSLGAVEMCYYLDDVGIQKIIEALAKQSISCPDSLFKKSSEDMLSREITLFLNCWDTSRLMPYARLQEQKIWKWFFQSERAHNFGMNKLQFFRHGSDGEYTIQIMGKDIDRVAEVFKDIFNDVYDNAIQQLGDNHTEAQSLFDQKISQARYLCTINQLPIKQSVSLTSKNLFDEKKAPQSNPKYTFSTNGLFSTFVKETASQLAPLMVDPRSLFYFSVTPSIRALAYISRQDRCFIKHTLTGHSVYEPDATN